MCWQKMKNKKYSNNKKTKADNKKSDFSNIRETILANLNLEPEWIEKLSLNPIPKIIKKGTPGDIFLLLRNVYNFTHTHALYRLVESSVFRQKGIHKIANKASYLKENKKETLFYHQLQKTHQLVNLGSTDYLNVIKNEIIKLMSFQDDNGRFPMNYHHHAHACNLLIDLGLEGNRLIDKAIQWVLTRQRFDGGWIHINNAPKGFDDKKSPSCIWTTAEIALLLSKRNIFKNSKSLSTAKVFLKESYLNKNKSTLLSKSDAWECLITNHTSEHMFAGGTLKILEIFLNTKSNDDKFIKKMIVWLLDQQMENSFFPKIANKFPVSDISVTNRALCVLKKYYENI